MAKQEAAIAGAGLVGSLLSLMLSNRGWKVDIYEKRPDMRQAEISGGRSINLALSDRGWKALEKAGIASSIREIALPMKGRQIHSQDGELTFQPYGKEDQAIFSVSRKELNIRLINLAEERGEANFHFEHKCLGMDLEEGILHLQDLSHDREIDVKKTPVFGTDGAFSACRFSLQKTDRFNYSQQYLEHGYKELSIPPTATGKWHLDKDCLHIWPRHRFMLIALPNLDGSFTCTLFLPFEGEPSFEKLDKESDLLAFFELYFPDALELMPTLIEDYYTNPTSSLCTVRCFPWSYKGNLLLLGDASHAIVPFYGQGMNAGFEDCTILDEMLDSQEGNFEKIFSQFERDRKPDTEAIADLALMNFIEMRDKVADEEFLFRKKLEGKIHALYPGKFTPLYTMVTFSHLPYAQALQRGKEQERLLDQIMSEENLGQKWESGEIVDVIHRHMQNWK